MNHLKISLLTLHAPLLVLMKEGQILKRVGNCLSWHADTILDGTIITLLFNVDAVYNPSENQQLWKCLYAIRESVSKVCPALYLKYPPMGATLPVTWHGATNQKHGWSSRGQSVCSLDYHIFNQPQTSCLSRAVKNSGNIGVHVTWWSQLSDERLGTWPSGAE